MGDGVVVPSLSNNFSAVQNAAARLIYNLRRCDHISDAIVSLYWLRVPQHITFKVAVLTYRVLHGTAPPYLTSSFTGVADMPHRRTLRSASTDQIDVSFFRQSTVRGHAFPVAGAKVWNSIPSDVTSAPSLPVLRKRLKHTYFAAVMLLSDDNLYPHWFGYRFPCTVVLTIVCLGYFKNVSWLIDWLSIMIWEDALVIVNDICRESIGVVLIWCYCHVWFIVLFKARSTPATMSKQHCRMLQCRMLLRHCCRFNVEATFDFVATNGNNVERVLRWNFVLSTKSNVASTLLLVWIGLK